jgi:hypothetical protein
MINGKYPVICPPQLLFDIRQDATWIAAAVFDAGKLKSLYSGRSSSSMVACSSSKTTRSRNWRLTGPYDTPGRDLLRALSRR